MTVGPVPERAGWLHSTLQWDSAFAVAAFVALLVDPVLSNEIGRLTPLDYVLAFITALPLTRRRQFPLGTLGLVVPLLLGCLAVFHPNRAAAGIVALLVFTVALEGHRHRSVMVGAVMALVVIGAVLLTSRHYTAIEVFAYLTPVLGALLAGEALRARRELAKTLFEEAARERESRAQHRFDVERLTWAHEVHDIVGHALVAINVRAAAAARKERRAGTDSDTVNALDDIAASSASALSELRGTLKMLRSANLSVVPLSPAAVLADVATLARHAEGAGLSVALDICGDLASLSAGHGHAGYRIIQEALTNVLNHSAAHRARVKIELDDRRLLIEVLDPGPPKKAVSSGGHGIVGMAERARALGGTCEAGPGADGRGWQVLAIVPLASGLP